jgi:hypothetical protein
MRKQRSIPLVHINIRRTRRHHGRTTIEQLQMHKNAPTLEPKPLENAPPKNDTTASREKACLKGNGSFPYLVISKSHCNDHE